jgi:hypothetical protein
MDENTRIKNRIHKTHDLYTLWQKLRGEGWQVWEAEDYTDNEQAPWHLYYIDRGNTKQGASVEVLFRDKTEQELAEDRELGLTPFKQEIEWVRY